MRLFSRTPGVVFRRSRAACVSLGLVILISGLGAQTSWGAPLARTHMGGRARGGETPITGATITLYEFGTSDYGSSPNQLATTTTDAQGSFTISSFSCTSPSSQLYFLSDGGDAGGGTNSAISLTAVLGPCVNAASFVFIDEVTTIASTYALARFTSTANPENIGSPTIASADHNGVNDAATLAITNLMDVTSGTAASFLSTGINSPAAVNSLADILTPCVNSSGPGSAECMALFSATTPSGGSAPTTTLGAALNIALYPSNNVGDLYTILQAAALQTGGLPFLPAYTSQPTDWLVGLNYAQETFAEFRGLALDVNGNAWVGNSIGPSIVVLSPLGATMSNITGAGISNPQVPAIDANGNVWFANGVNNTVTELDSTGTILFTTPAASGGLHQPLGVSIDSFGQIWVANFNGTVTELCGSTPGNCPAGSQTVGAPISPASGYKGGGLLGSSRIAIDTLFNNVWVSNLGSGGATELDAAGAPIGHFPGGGQQAEEGIAVDPLGHIWTANKTSVTELSTAGAVLLGPITGGGITPTSRPFGIGSDSSGYIWVTNFAGNSVTEIAPDGTLVSPDGGYTAGGLITFPRNSIVVDASGNVWLTMNQPSSVTELVGASAPTTTPTIGRPLLPFSGS